MEAKEPAAAELGRIQRLLRRWITAPEGVQSALDADGDPEGHSLAAVVRGDAALPALRRLDVYANAYFYRIHDCLADDFGALRAALGAELFNDLVALYLAANPPRHPSLRHAGDRLAGFLRDAASAAPFRARAPWAGDLARLEWALVDAFDAPDAPVVPRDALAELAPDAWESLRLAFQPALQCLDLDWAVQSLREAYDRDEDVAGRCPERGPATAIVWRAGERVLHRPADPSEARALELARGGGSFGALCLAIAATTGEDAAPGVAAKLLARWLDDQLIAALHPA